MASGYGLTGGAYAMRRTPIPPAPLTRPNSTILTRSHAGPSRCFPFWQEVLACYVVNTTSDDDSGKAKCSRPLEDYYECLHHKKEVYCPPHPTHEGAPASPQGWYKGPAMLMRTTM